MMLQNARGVDRVYTRLVTLDHFVMVRIHARQPLEDELLTI